MAEVRLQKLLAEAGIASRRKSEQIILEGRVSVDGKVVRELGTKVNPEKSRITVDGRPLRLPRKVYILLNKPKGVVSSTVAQDERRTVVDLLKGVPERVYPAGRLDEDSEGLIVLTNDGEFANLLTHPRYGIKKVYRAEVRGRIDDEALDKLRKGVWLSAHRGAKKARPENVRVIYISREKTVLEITLAEGQNREVRRILARTGYKVKSLKRIAIGTITDPKLAKGQWRPLTRKEIESIRRLAARHCS